MHIQLKLSNAANQVSYLDMLNWLLSEIRQLFSYNQLCHFTNEFSSRYFRSGTKWTRGLNQEFTKPF